MRGAAGGRQPAAAKHPLHIIEFTISCEEHTIRHEVVWYHYPQINPFGTCNGKNQGMPWAEVRAGPDRWENCRGPGRAKSFEKLTGGAGPRHMRCRLFKGRSAQPMRWPTCFQGSAGATAHDKRRTDATTMTTSTRPMRRPMHFHGPARATDQDMWCTEIQNDSFLCFCILHLAERTNSSKQQRAAAGS